LRRLFHLRYEVKKYVLDNCFFWKTSALRAESMRNWAAFRF